MLFLLLFLKYKIANTLKFTHVARLYLQSQLFCFHFYQFFNVLTWRDARLGETAYESSITVAINDILEC